MNHGAPAALPAFWQRGLFALGGALLRCWPKLYKTNLRLPIANSYSRFVVSNAALPVTAAYLADENSA